MPNIILYYKWATEYIVVLKIIYGENMNLAIIMISFLWGCGGSEQPEVQKESSAVKQAPVKTNENLGTKPPPPGEVTTPPKSQDGEIEAAPKEMDKATQEIVEDPKVENTIEAKPTNDPELK